MSQPTACPDQRQLQRYAYGEIAGPAAESITQHVRQCSVCREVIRSQTGATQGVPDSETATTGAAAQATAPGGPARADATTFDFLAPPQAPGEIGRLGGYSVRKLLGRGAMGLVFEAQDVRLRRPVALKV